MLFSNEIRESFVICSWFCKQEWVHGISNRESHLNNSNLINSDEIAGERRQKINFEASFIH